jgi:hypothetical protein
LARRLAGGAAENRIIAAFFTNVLNRIYLPVTGLDRGDRATAAGALMLRADGHHLDMSLFGRDGLHHDALALGTRHGYSVAGLEVFNLRAISDMLHKQLRSMELLLSTRACKQRGANCETADCPDAEKRFIA